MIENAAITRNKDATIIPPVLIVLGSVVFTEILASFRP